MPSVLRLSTELIHEVTHHLDLASFKSLRLACSFLCHSSKRKFASRFLVHCRLRLDREDLDQFLALCASDAAVVCAVRELHFSSFMVDTSREAILRQLEDDVRGARSFMKSAATLASYVNQFYAQAPDGEITEKVRLVLEQLPNIHTIGSSALPEDIRDIQIMEEAIVRGLSESPYKQWHYLGEWRYMRPQHERSTQILVTAIATSKAKVSKLLIDGHTGTELDTAFLASVRSFTVLGGFTTQLHNLDICLVADENLDFDTVWLMRLTLLCPQLCHMTLRFVPMVELSVLKSIIERLDMSQLKSLTLAGVWTLAEQELISVAAINSDCQITVASLQVRLNAIMAPQTAMANLRIVTRLQEPRLGRRWFSAVPNAHADMSMFAFGRCSTPALYKQVTVYDVEQTNVELLVVWGKARSDLVIMPFTAFLSYSALVGIVTNMLDACVLETQEKMGIIHVSTDGALVMAYIDEDYVNYGNLGRSIAEARCWIENRHRCLLLLELSIPSVYGTKPPVARSCA